MILELYGPWFRHPDGRMVDARELPPTEVLNLAQDKPMTLLDKQIARGLEAERQLASLPALFEDHYWDTFEPDKALILEHVRSVLAMRAND
jgi:hypothetical protein